jgi:hypothetical protein
MQDAPESELDPSRLIAASEDRRMFRRIALNLLTHVRFAGPTQQTALCDSATEVDEALYTFQSVIATDISMTGLFFPSARSYPANADVEINLCLNRTHFIIPGTVARRTRVDNRHFGYGVNFCQRHTSKEFRLALAAYLLRHDCAVPR